MKKYQQSLYYSDQEQQGHQSFEEMRSIIKEEQESKKMMEGIRRKRGRPPKQPQVKKIINRQNYHKLFFQYCENIEVIQYYSMDQYQQPFYSWVFTEIMVELRNRQSTSQKSIQITKFRTLIIFKVIEDFMKDLNPELQSKQSQNLLSLSKKYYENANIQVPPSVPNVEYIANLFKNKQLKSFYGKYLKQNKLRSYFLTKCYNQVLQFCDQISQIGQCLYDNQKRQWQFIKQMKPMTLLQVKQLQEQANRIYSQYCR